MWELHMTGSGGEWVAISADEHFRRLEEEQQ
jgi:hypothetical protein